MTVPSWIKTLVKGECDCEVEMGFFGTGVADRYVRMPCAREAHFDDNHEVRDFNGTLMAWTGTHPHDRDGKPEKLTHPSYLIEEEP